MCPAYLFCQHLYKHECIYHRNVVSQASCKGKCMVCMNLPLEIRYLPENMYLVGIIPGPFEPKGTDLNHYIRPIIDNMEIAWERGIYIS
jgi:hypothetical protein